MHFEFMKMPDVAGLGSYTESGQAIRMSYQGEATGPLVDLLGREIVTVSNIVINLSPSPVALVHDYLADTPNRRTA